MYQKLLNFDKNWLTSWNNFANSSFAMQYFFKILAEYLIYLSPLILVILWFWQAVAKKVALRATLSGLLSWLLVSSVIGRLIARPRPFENGFVKELFFHRPTYSFPSDHTAFLIAVAFSFWLSGYKRLSLFMFILAGIISLSRIAAGIHYPSDIFGGALIGLIVSWLVWLFDRPLDYLYNFLINIARKLRLA